MINQPPRAHNPKEIEFDEWICNDIANLKKRILCDPANVLDPENIHHQFASGNHGRKLDLDKIVRGSDLYMFWVSVYARVIRATYADELPDAIVGIANGANRLAEDIAVLLGDEVIGLKTEKVSAKTVKLDQDALKAIAKNNVQFAVTIEDVGSTGGTSATAIEDLRKLGVPRIEAFNSWQRSPTLPSLDQLGVTYHAVILYELPMFSPEACTNDPEGYCFKGAELILHSK